MADNDLSQAILAIQSGDMERAKAILSAILHQDPNNVNAWRWMAAALDDPGKKRQCWQRVLSLKPDDEQAMQALSLPRDSASPKKLVITAQKSRKPILVAVLLVMVGLVIVAVVVAASAWFLYFGPAREKQLFLEETEDIVERWDATNARASSTARIALSPVVGELQDIRQEMDNVQCSGKSCECKEATVDYMDYTIDTYLAFMTQESDAKIESMSRIANSKLERAAECLAELRGE